MPGNVWMWFSSERQRLPQRDYSVTWYSDFLDPPRWSSGESLWRKFPGYLHGSIEALAEEKPGSIRCWSPLLLYVSNRGNRVHVGFIWQISARTGYVRRTMRSSVVWKNMVVAIIKSKKVYSVSYNFGESVCIFSFHLEWKEDNFLMLLTTFRLPAQLCCWNSCRISEAALQLLLWHVYIFFLSLHLAGPASFVVLNSPWSRTVLFFSEQECLASLNCRCSSFVCEDVAADHLWGSSWSDAHLFLGDGISENSVSPLCYPHLLFSAPQLFFIHSGCNLSSVRLLLPPVLTHQFLNAPDRDTGGAIGIKILSDYYLRYL